MTEPALHDVIDGLEVLICGLDGDGKIHLFNRPCERLTGIGRENAIGLSWLELFASSGRGDHVQALWSQARTDAPTGPYEALCRKGRNLRWHFSRHSRGGPSTSPRTARRSCGRESSSASSRSVTWSPG